MKFSKVKKNPENPRYIPDEKFEQMKLSIVQFPEMLKYRPIVVKKDATALGGNMRLEGLKVLHKEGFDEYFPENFTRAQIAYRQSCYAAIRKGEFLSEWIARAEDLTDEQQKEFIIKDNIPYGKWDNDLIEIHFKDLPLAAWGFDYIPPTDIDLSGFFDNDFSAEKPEKHTIKLEFETAELKTQVEEKLLEKSETLEKGILSLLGL